MPKPAPTPPPAGSGCGDETSSDRVMMRDNEIVVVDFKFGKQNKKYNKQVQGYMQLLTRMGYPKESIKGYLWYVEEDLIEKV